MPVEEDKDRVDESFRPDDKEKASPQKLFKSMRPKGKASSSDVPPGGLDVGGGTVVTPPVNDGKRQDKPAQDKPTRD